MLSGDAAFLREGKERLYAILGDEESVRFLIKKAFETSPTATRIPFEERSAQVRVALEGQSASSGEIAARLRPHGITPASTKNTLQNMRRQGAVISERIPGTRELSWSLVTGNSAV